MSTPLTRRAFATFSAALGTFGMVSLVIVMNAGEFRQEDDGGQAQTSFSVQAPPKKTPPKQKPQRKAKPKKSRSRNPPAPLIGASLSGLSFGLDGLDGGLVDDASALLGDIRDVVMTAETVDELPVPVQQVAPQPPGRARQKGISGVVVVSLLIGVDGRVQDIDVLESRPPGVFDDAAVTAVRQWRYQPARYQGEPVPLRIDVPIRFDFE
ncbi:MAG: protein TonB [Myxococcota bacterium]|jgi:protein TonB